MEAERNSPDIIREYNEFGTWIAEVTEENMIPKLFRNYYSEKNTPEFMIKIPRKVERRLAYPGMDLYDFLIGAFDDYLYILKRNGKKAEEKKIIYKEIVAVKKVHSLLKGELYLFLTDSVIIVNYNTVSDEAIVKMIRIIQKKKAGEQPGKTQFEKIQAEYDPRNPDSMDIYLFNITNKVIQADPEMALVAYQKGLGVFKKPAQLSKRIKMHFKVKKRILTKGSFLSDGIDIVIVTCDVTIRNKSSDGYTYSNTYFGIRDISDIRIEEYDLPMTKRMEIDIKGRKVDFVFDDKNNMIKNLYGMLKSMSSNYLS